MSVINTNVKSLVAQQSLGMNERNMSTVMERLSTGNRINSARDDAAGLSIASRMDSQIRGLNMAIRNANDGTSLMQTAEGAMQEVTNMLQRMRELSVQAINGVNNDSDRAALNAEVQQLKAEIDRISATTTFNNQVLLDGTFGQRDLQIGNQAGQTLTVGMADVRTVALGVDMAAALTAHGFLADDADDLVEAASLSTGDLVINGVAISGTREADDGLSFEAKDASAIAKAAAINRATEQTGVRAVVGQTVFQGTKMDAAELGGTVTINGVATAEFDTTEDAGESRDIVVAAINAISAQTGVRAVNTGSDEGGVQLIADDGRNISVELDTVTDVATGLGDDGVQSGKVNLVSTDGRAITVTSESLDPTVLEKSGLAAGTFAASEAAFTTFTRATVDDADDIVSLELGDLKINGVTISASVKADDTASDESADTSSKSASGIAIAAAINRHSEETGVRAVVNANVVVGTDIDTSSAAGTEALFLNGVTIDGIGEGFTRQEVADRINAFTGQTGVTASDNGQGITLMAADGRNISLGTGDEAVFGLNADDVGGDATADDAETHYSSVRLVSDSAFTVDRASNDNENLTALGFFAGTFGGDGEGMRLSELSVATEADASRALGALDSAIATVSDARAELGAKQNRLEYTVNNLAGVVTNTSAAQSQIRDTDYAVETTNLARSQIVQQAATAMLAQANQQPSTVLALLQ